MFLNVNVEKRLFSKLNFCKIKFLVYFIMLEPLQTTCQYCSLFSFHIGKMNNYYKKNWFLKFEIIIILFSIMILSYE
jgi:hypothetical protein